MNAPLPLPDGLLAEVRAHYATPHRPYHSFAHVEDLVRWFHQVPAWTQPREVFCAILFHDAVYVAGRSDNEELSARLATQQLSRFLPGEGLQLPRIEELIRLTARHGTLTAADVDSDAAYFLDCDMAILGSAPAQFAAYNAAIEEEYQGHVPSVLYRLGRLRFLTRLVASPRIYLSEFFHARLEAQARENLRHLLADGH